MEGSSQIGQPLVSVEMVLTNACLRPPQQVRLHWSQPLGHARWQEIALSPFPAGNWHQPALICCGKARLEAVHQSIQDPVGVGSLEVQQAAAQGTVIHSSGPPGQGMQAFVSADLQPETFNAGWTGPGLRLILVDPGSAQRANRLCKQRSPDLKQGTQHGRR